MTLSVRHMKPSDIDAVYSIELAAHRAPWPRDILAECLHAGFDCRVLDSQDGEDVTLVGYVMCRYTENSCHILNLCVAPALQGNGYGQILLQDIIDSPAEAFVYKLVLEVRPSNIIANRLYKKMGFQQVAIKRGYYRDTQSIEDAIILEKQL